MCLWALDAFASPRPIAVIETLNTPFNLAPFIEYLEDPDRQITYKELYEETNADKYSSHWQSNTEGDFIGRKSNVRYWFRISLSLPNSFATYQPVLYLPNQAGLIWQLKLWIPDSEGPHQAGQNEQPREITTGYLHPYNQRDIKNQQYVFRLPTNLSTFTLIGWVDQGANTLPALLPLYVLSNEQMNTASYEVQGILIAFYAVMSALLLYNACLFASLKESVYGFYLLFLISAIYVCAECDGSTLRWLWPNDPQMNLRLGAVAGTLAPLFYLAFVLQALDHLYFMPRLRWCFRVIIGFGCLVALHNIFTPYLHHATILSQLYPSFVLPLTFTAIIGAIRQKIPSAIYLLVAEFFTTLGSVSFILTIQGILPLTQLTVWSLHQGFLGEALLLSLALASRTRVAQQIAIQSLQKYEDLYANSLQALFTHSLKDGTFSCNKAWAAIYGYSNAEELVASGIPSEDFKKFSGQYSNQELYGLLKKNGTMRDIELDVPVANSPNKKRKLLISISLIRDAYGEPDYIDGSGVDITDRTLAEEAERARAAADARNQANSQFFASMSHELRTPLTAILGYSEVALSEQIGNQQVKFSVEAINRSGQHLLHIINDILDISKIEAQKLDVERSQIYLLPLIDEVKDTIEILAKPKGLAFTIAYHFPLPKIITNDSTRIKQVLINLCGNAIKFTEKGGVTIDIRSEPENELLIFAISDTGIGLKPEQVDNLFAAFTQADSSITRNFGGTGLGLYLSKQLAKKLGGDIALTSVYGEGSTFTVSIATGSLLNAELLEDTSGEQNTEVEKSLLRDGPVLALNGRVLYAEDNEDNQRLVKNIVEQTGASITLASNGRQALDICALQTFNVVFADVRMPIIDGVELVQLLHQNNPDLPVVAITATLTADESEEFKAAGFTHVLTKPIDRKGIIDLLKLYLLSGETAQIETQQFNHGNAMQQAALRVLLAEDNVDNQSLISLYLKRSQAEVTVVDNGADALVKALTDEFDFVLMDMQMPVMDGLTAVRSLRANGFSKPIYALTANETAEAIQQCKAAGCDGHLSKPLDSEKLAALIAGIKK